MNCLGMAAQCVNFECLILPFYIKSHPPKEQFGYEVSCGSRWTCKLFIDRIEIGDFTCALVFSTSSCLLVSNYRWCSRDELSCCDVL